MRLTPGTENVIGGKAHTSSSSQVFPHGASYGHLNGLLSVMWIILSKDMNAGGDEVESRHT